MPQAGFEPTSSWLLEWSLSEFCHEDSCVSRMEIKIYKMFNDQPLLISVTRSLLSYCTVIVPLATMDPAMICVHALGQVECMKSFKTNIAFMKSPGKHLNITRQMTTIDHPDSILKISPQEMETPLLRMYTLFQFMAGLILTWKEKKG